MHDVSSLRLTRSRFFWPLLVTVNFWRFLVNVSAAQYNFSDLFRGFYFFLYKVFYDNRRNIYAFSFIAQILIALFWILRFFMILLCAIIALISWANQWHDSKILWRQLNGVAPKCQMARERSVWFCLWRTLRFLQLNDGKILSNASNRNWSQQIIHRFANERSHLNPDMLIFSFRQICVDAKTLDKTVSKYRGNFLKGQTLFIGYLV